MLPYARTEKAKPIIRERRRKYTTYKLITSLTSHRSNVPYKTNLSVSSKTNKEKEFKNMKRNEHIIAVAPTTEGVHTIKITDIRKADKITFGERIGNKVIIEGTLETGKVERVFLNMDKVGKQTESFYESAIFALADQYEEREPLPVDDNTFDSDDIALMSTVFIGKPFTCYCVHNTAADGKTYSNIYFKKTAEVIAMLEMR